MGLKEVIEKNWRKFGKLIFGQRPPRKPPKKSRVPFDASVLRRVVLGATRRLLWAGAGAPGGTVRRAAVRKRGSGAHTRSYYRLPDLTRSNRGQIRRDLEEYIQIDPPTIR